MGQQQDKEDPNDPNQNKLDTNEASGYQEETDIETLGSLNDDAYHELDEQTTTKRVKNKRRKKKPPEKVKSFLSEGNAKELKLSGSFKKLEEQQIHQDAKQQNFFLEDIPEEGATGSLPPPDQFSSTMSLNSQRKAKKRLSRKAKMRIAPLMEGDEGSTCISLSNLNAVMVPNELFDIAVIPPPPEFSTADVIPEESDDIQEIYEQIDPAVFKQLADTIVTPVACDNFGETDDEYITFIQLFNCLNDGQKSPYMFDPTFLLLIDTRPKAAYDKRHIATAHHVLDVKKNIEDFKPVDQYTMIVLYDEDGKQYSLKNSDISIAMDMLLAEDADAFILEDGFSKFNSKFPYWCTKRVPTDLKQRAELILSLPSIVLEGKLYIGQADQASKRCTIEYLAISHIVCISHEAPRQMKGVTYHHINLTDEPSSKLHEHFADAITFITEALARAGTVLVHCNLGQSRSATVVIAYLMFTNHWTLKDALKFLRNCRPVVHPNEGFMNQLLCFETILFGKRYTDISKLGYKILPIVIKDRSQDSASKENKPPNLEITTTENREKMNTNSQIGSDKIDPKTNTAHQNESHNKMNNDNAYSTPKAKIVEVKNSNQHNIVNGIIQCKVQSSDELIHDDFEEEIMLGDATKTGGRGVLNDAQKELSASRETLDKTIIAI